MVTVVLASQGPTAMQVNIFSHLSTIEFYVAIQEIKSSCSPQKRSESLIDCKIAGPVNAAGQAYDPAAETYKKQVTDL